MDLRTYNLYCSKKNIMRTLQIEQSSNKHLRQAHASKKINHHQHISTGLVAKFSEWQSLVNSTTKNLAIQQQRAEKEGSGRTWKRNCPSRDSVEILKKIAPHDLQLPPSLSMPAEADDAASAVWSNPNKGSGLRRRGRRRG